MKNFASFLVKPIISEKSFTEAKAGKYTFLVDKAATKTDIKNAVEMLFSVDVRNVYTANIKGTKTRNTRTGRRILPADYKKARVKLANGQKIAIFEESTGEEKKEDKKKEKETKK
ncbi:MAG TPA: 50S ribosomal protein L23 [Patescibacteria group bacterium]|nr:50S ribosomal protein L23 [Patescibacteria group bacterium]